MLSRRDVIAGGVVGSLAGAAASPAEAVEQEEQTIRALRAIEDEVQRIHNSIDRAFNSVSLAIGPVGQLRKVFEQFLRSNGKFPDFCEVGAQVFYDIYDWHVRNRQQIVVVRQPDNRYTIQFMFTTLILKFENEPGFIGYPFDKV